MKAAAKHYGQRIADNVLVTLVSLVGLTFSVPAAAKVPVAEIGNNKIKLEVARTDEEITRGLMYRTSLPPHNGMVFLFRPSRPVKFWMKNCFISLDMLFIKDGKIVKICENVPPCKEPAGQPCPTYPDGDAIEVSEVVEVNAHYARKYGIKEGDAVRFVFPTTKKPAKGVQLGSPAS